MLSFLAQDETVDNSKNRDKIWHEQVKFVAQSAALSNWLSYALVILITGVFWGDTHSPILLGWFVFMSVITLRR